MDAQDGDLLRDVPVSSLNVSAWLATLIPGDEVLIPGEFLYQPGQIQAIDKVLPREFVMVNGRRANRVSGNVIGARVTIRPATQADRDRIEAHKLAAWLRDVANARVVPLERLRAMRAAYFSFD